MKLVHLSDLHLGKRVNEFSMMEDQEYILTKIINIIDDEKPDAVLIAGDVYDKSMPSAEAVHLFDDFLFKLSKRELQVFIISGNHDSAERIAFGSRLMDQSGIHMSPVYHGEVLPFILEDTYGKVNIFMMPFVKPINVKSIFPDEEISDYTNALNVAVNNMNVDEKERNVIITHQFVTGALRCESEELSIGGTDNVDVSVFEAFDYVALGHIHGPQKIKRDTVRYCGTPLKYSFSEVNHKKSVTVVDMKEKGNIEISQIPLIPKRDMREIKGTFDDICKGPGTEDYMHITLTDEQDIPYALGKLRVFYPNLMKLDYDNARTRSSQKLQTISRIEEKTPIELFSEFYEKQNGQKMNEEQAQLVTKLMEQIWED